ncbi:sialate O-acetylesterase-like [Ylistrum balloti]|uniref:sialate O-acetylesterase-like n=1 Tax=Ylistrum balloti TaxID=509963 RepID=UPI002905D965|nr:sialate O-acetylesterase-like [Ylistrum balloti]
MATDDTSGTQEVQHSNSNFKFAAYYGDHMVLQRAPKQAVVWGYHPFTYVYVGVTIGNNTQYGLVNTHGVWSVILDPVEDPGPYNITAHGLAGEISLTDVLFGDVWVCSGQSNMEFTVRMGNNATEEIQDANNYPSIRVFTVNQRAGSSTPLSDFTIKNSIKQYWSVASNTSIGGSDKDWGYFSAVCWLYGKYLYQKLGYPIGLVNTCWGGTAVEAWSSPEALLKCGLFRSTKETEKTRFTDPDRSSDYRYSDKLNFSWLPNYSGLWNAMVHPFLNMTIYGVIWYQGESNAPSPHDYNCTFPSMISDWRVKFHASHGQNDPAFPFGFVMLGANEPDMTKFDGFPEIRWHQTADFGYVPNSKMANTFMANAMDLPDFLNRVGSIHPGDKQDVARRLVNASLAVAYHHKDIVYQAPLPTGYKVDTEARTLEIVYNNGSEALQLKNNVGFEICCSYGNITDYYDQSWWVQTSVDRITRSTVVLSTAPCPAQTITGVRYAWRISPCSFKDCALYSLLSSLPASPFFFTSRTFSRDGSYVIDGSVPHSLPV